MKFFKVLFRVLVTILGLVGLLIIWFAGQVSAVYDPIKSYTYPLTRDDLKERIVQTTKINPNFTFELTDSTGTDINDLSYYAHILFKAENEEYEFQIKFNKKSSFWDSEIQSQIALTAAFDKVRRTGGYQREDPEVERLVDIFERQIINKLRADTSR